MHQTNHSGKGVSALINLIEGISPDCSLEEVAELFADEKYSKLLSLPVVEDGRPIGVISRYRFMDIYLKRYARELHGKRPVRAYLNSDLLLVELDQPLAVAAQHVAANMQFPLTEDFIITQDGEYLGVGFVMELLQAMEMQMRASNSELELANAQIKSSQLALVQSEKMASLGQMVAGIAHEMLGEMHGLMDDSLYGIAQISELVLNLKNFSRMDAAATEAVSLNDCIESALNIGRNVLKDKVEVIKELGDLPMITCAPSQLNQVFLNLFTNAAQAMEGQGKLYIKTWSADDSVHISVADNGKGIPGEILTRIFDPFFTTKPVGEGTGLGLAISHQIIQKHGGEIHAESRIGEGTRFQITLPIAIPIAVPQPAVLEEAA